jgi:hypothetical protein
MLISNSQGSANDCHPQSLPQALHAVFVALLGEHHVQSQLHQIGESSTIGRPVS